MVFDPQSRHALKRFLLKLAFLSAAVLPQAHGPWGFKVALMTLAIASAMISLGLAAFFRERPIARTLNYWDEAVVFLAVGVAARWLP